jgi:DNA-binding MltR family transcriptional regulator
MEEKHQDTSADHADLAAEWTLHFEKSIRRESTRAKVVLSVCYLDELLHQLIRMVLAARTRKDDPLFDGTNAPLGTFSAKIELAYRLGLIGHEVEQSLQYIRKIRNRFAHEISTCTFDDPEVLAWNRELHRLNDRASPETRSRFSPGPIGDFEKSVSWLVYWLKSAVQRLPTGCPRCGTDLPHRIAIRDAKPIDVS